jgi:flagellar biosynthesis protein FlhA
MTVNRETIGTLSYGGITLLIMAVVIFPIPPVFLDFLIALNITLAALLLADVRFNKDYKNHLSFPAVLFGLTIFNLANSLIVTRLILTMDEYFESRIIRFIASPLEKLGTIGVIAFALLFVILMTIHLYFYSKKIISMTEKNEYLILEKKEALAADIEEEYGRGLITIEEITERKEIIQEEVDFYSTINRTAKFALLNEKIRFALFFINATGGAFISIRLRGEIYKDVFEKYISLAASGCFFSLVSSVILTAAVWTAGAYLQTTSKSIALQRFL